MQLFFYLKMTYSGYFIDSGSSCFRWPVKLFYEWKRNILKIHHTWTFNTHTNANVPKRVC